MISMILLIVTFLGPMGLNTSPISSNKGIDCIWILDTSMSMDVTDVKYNNAQISRLARAKYVIENYMISHPENRYGLVIFAGNARLISPITTDYSSLLTFLESIDSKSIWEGGTDFYQALQLALDRFDTQKTIPHAMILLSDGGDKEDIGNKTIFDNLFLNHSAYLTTIGIWNTQWSPIPVGHNPIGEIIYKKYQDRIILSGLNEKNMEFIAKIGKWTYIEWTSLEKDLENSLTQITRQTFKKSWDTFYDVTQKYSLWLSFLFFVIFLLFPSSFSKKWNDL